MIPHKYSERVPLGDLENWLEVLSHDDPKSTELDKQELQRIYNFQVSKSALDAVRRGLSFESWVTEFEGEIKATKEQIEAIKPELLKAYLDSERYIKSIGKK